MEPLLQNALLRQARIDAVPLDPETGQPAALIDVEVDAIPINLTLPGGVLLPDAGKHRVQVYATNLPGILALVEDADAVDLEAAARDLERHKQRCEAGENDRPHEPCWPGSFRHITGRDPKPLRSARVIGADERNTSRRKAS